MMTPLQREELTEVFLFAFREAGLDAALEAHANAAVMMAACRKRMRRQPPQKILLPAVRVSCELCAVTPAQFAGPDKTQAIANCRALACWVLRQEGMSLQKIANAIGRTDHTTVLGLLRRCEQRPELLRKAQEIREILTGIPAPSNLAERPKSRPEQKVPTRKESAAA